MLGRAPRIKETLLVFCENMDPDKWDKTVWYRVTQNPQESYGLTGCQRDPRIWGVTAWCHSLGKRLPRELECGHTQVIPEISIAW